MASRQRLKFATGPAVEALRTVDRYLQFCIAASDSLAAGMPRTRALREAEIATGIGLREIAESGRHDLRAVAEQAFELVDIDPERVAMVRRLLPGWH